MKKLTGTCVCPGEVKGTIKFYAEDKVFTKETIVVLNEYVTQNIMRLKDVGGILSSKGGITCHASIIAREFNIPCLVSVQGLEEVEEGMIVKMDAAAEEVTFQ
ncbi:MAG: PEP-utilizing enzyme, partial [Nanoarchaeota archaeon]|nr:PEP-utilizing enzyme [Nanoarchaeota archaeon]